MFSRLPPELIRQIIESTVPSTYQSETYCDRQALLQSLCLVCPLFKDIAQPLLFEFLIIGRQSKLDALLTMLEAEDWRGTIRRLVLEDTFKLDSKGVEKLLRSCRGLRSLTLKWDSLEPLDLLVLHDLPHLADLFLCDEGYRFPAGFKLHALTSLSIHHTTIKFAPTLLNSKVLPSLRSLAMFQVYEDHAITYLAQSRLADLVPQLEVLHLNARILQNGLDYLIPALPYILFDCYPDSSNAQVDMSQHLRIPYHLRLESLISQLVESIKNRDRRIPLRTIYLNGGLANLPSLSADTVTAMQDLLRVCQAKGIEVIYENQELGIAAEIRPSEEFGRRQREIRKSWTVGK